jgi:hypothetical protein
MSQDHAAFGHHPDQVSGTQLETQIPPDTKHNNFLIEMSSFEENEAWRRGHLTIIPSSPICFHRLHQNLYGHAKPYVNNKNFYRSNPWR